MTIKVAHVNYYENEGGAAIAVNRIIGAQKENGIDTKLVVANKKTIAADIVGPLTTLEEIKWKILTSINRKFEKFEKKKKYDSNSYNLIPNNFVNKINSLDIDIVNLHWIGNNLIPIKDIKKIKKPIVWTLHDMWPYAGSEHYTIHDRIFKGYSKSNKPETNKGFDFEKYCWNLKKKHYPKKMKIIATSDWQFRTAKKSLLFKDYEIEKILYPLDFNFWKPINKIDSRKILNLPKDKKIILIGAERLDSYRKGFHLLYEIINGIESKDILLIFFGKLSNKSIFNFDNIKTLFFSNLAANSIDLKILYSAADLFVAPSIQESFGITVQEAASCCLPTVCFKNNGIADTVKHHVNGYIANDADTKDFSRGIDWCLNKITNETMEKNLDILKKIFSYSTISEKYKSLYEKLIYEKN